LGGDEQPAFHYLQYEFLYIQIFYMSSILEEAFLSRAMGADGGPRRRQKSRGTKRFSTTALARIRKEKAFDHRRA
jgi:hypothetical protein